MGGSLSILYGSQQQSTSAFIRRAQIPLVNVHDFVINNINGVFDALQEAGFEGSNCYALLHTLIKGNITSDDLRATGLDILPYAFEGETSLYDKFPEIYYFMLLSVLRETTKLDITELLEKKQKWIRNPSDVVNKLLKQVGARKRIAQDADAQNNAINAVCKNTMAPAKSAGGEARKCNMRALFNGASIQAQNRCCICGLDQPPPLTDIEHVVSSQLLILLGLCPGTKSWVGFRRIFNELNNTGDDNKKNNWVKTIINYFPDKKQKIRARDAFRSMMLPAHAYCNQTIKREWSPFYVDKEGNIQADIRAPFEDMGNQTYMQKVIKPSIDYVNDTRNTRDIPKKRNRGELAAYTEEWITKQQKTFKELAWLLNSIDQRNNRGSLFLIDYLYRTANEKDNDSDRAAFSELVSDILGLKKGTKWGDMESVLSVKNNQLKIATTLTLVVEAILVLFQSDIQNPTQEAIEENSGSDIDNEYSSQGSATLHSSIDDADSESSFTTESELSSIDYNKNFSSSDDESQNSNSKSQSSTTGTSSIMSNELRNPTDPASKKRMSPIKQLDRTERQIKRATLNDNQIIEIEANAAVNELYSGADINPATRENAMRVATNAARNALNNATDDTDRYDLAYNAASAALIDYNNDTFSNELRGGSRNHTTCKYTKTSRCTTRKRRPSKKPRRTIRRRAPRRIQTRRK
jgi:hypothetical protein